MGRYQESEVRETLDQVFGEGSADRILAADPTYRGVRLKIQPTGHLTLAHPKASGPYIISVQQVPAGVSDAEVLRRMGTVHVARKDRTVHYNEIKAGAIVR